MSLGSALSKVGSKISSALTSRAGKFAVGSAVVGGGTYAALTGVGAGISNIGEATGISSVFKLITGDNDTSKGIGTLLGIAILVGLVLFAVKVVLPAVKNVKTNKGASA